MKKIYILTAVFALLTLSLNAQTIYQKVTSASQIISGKKYIVVYEDGNLAMGALSSNYGAAISVTISDNSIDISGTDVIELTLTEVGTKSIYSSEAGSNVTVKTYSLRLPNNGNYLGYNGSGTGIRTNATATDNYLWFYGPDLSTSNMSNMFSAEYNTRSIAKGETSSGAARFGAYASPNSVLYVQSGDTPTPTATLTAPVNGSTVNVGTNTGSGVNKEITVSGSNLAADLTVSVSGTGFSVSPTTITAANANAGTTVTVTYNGTVENATGTLTISSSEVSTTVNLTATYNNGTTPTPSGDVVTICAGNASSQYLPVYGYYFDDDQTNQMLYPANKFTDKDMADKIIKSITFYPTTGTSTYGTTYSGINFYQNYNGGTVTIKLANMPSGTTGYTYDSPERKVPTGGFTTVKTITMPTEAQANLTEWVFDNLENDFVYEGGDLLIEVVTGEGGYGYTFFAGESQTDYMGYYSYEGYFGTTSYGQQFLPKVTFTCESSLPKTDAPTITVGDPTATDVTVTATATDPTASVTLTIGDRTETGTGTVSITIDRGTADQNLTATATAQEDGKRVSDPATAPVYIPALPKTATPTINVVTNADGSKTISATGDGIVHLYVDGVEVSNPYTIMPSVDGDQTVTVTATAQEEGKQISDPATETVTVAEAGRSPMPNITMTDNGDGTYTITVTGTGDLAVYIDDAEHGGTAGDPIATGNGSVSFTVEEHSRAMTITVQATNQEGDLAISRTAEETYTIPAMSINGFTQLDPQPENASSPIDMSKLMFVDRFSVDIPEDNSHPFQYDYTLEETQVRQRSSNTVEVYVEKTGSEGKGFYTLKQIDDDKDAKLVMDVENAAMDFNLSELSAPFFYTVEREEEADGETYWGWNAILQRTSVGNYKQTLKYDTKGNLVYNYNDTILPGPHVQLDLDTITGDYNDYMAYVPVVWTMGFDRVNYDENNPTHNSYGASVWTTGVADVVMDPYQAPKAERQRNDWNSVNWTAEGGPASLYILDNVVATATMPTVNTLEYEPYMFRIFVKSENNMLRPYTVVPAGDGPYDGEHLDAGEGTTEGPVCVWSGYVNDPKNNQPEKLTTDNGEIDNPDYNGVEITEGRDGNAVTYTFKKMKVDRPAGYSESGKPLGPWDQDGVNAMFGALDELANKSTITLDDLEVFVRFYYIVKGMGEGHTPWIVSRDANAESDPAGYGVEAPGTAPEPATDVIEIAYHGEVVGQTYFNIQGMQSDKPFDGVNIVVTRYSDGATSVSKVIR